MIVRNWLDNLDLGDPVHGLSHGHDSFGLRKSEARPSLCGSLSDQVSVTDSSGDRRAPKQCVAVEQSLRELGTNHFG